MYVSMRTIASPTPTALTFTAISVFVLELLKLLFTVIVGMFRGEMMVRGRNYRARKSNTGQSKQTNKQIHARTHAPTHTSPSCLCSCSQCLHVWMGGCRGDGASAATGMTTTCPPCWFMTRDLCMRSRLLNEVVRGYRCLYIYLHGGERR